MTVDGMNARQRATLLLKELGPQATITQILKEHMRRWGAPVAPGTISSAKRAMGWPDARFNPWSSREATTVITVRLPESLHELLLKTAKAQDDSLNMLCVKALAELVGHKLEPEAQPC